MTMPQPDDAASPAGPDDRADNGRPTVAAVVADLMFVSRLRGLARAAGAELRVMKDPAALAGVEASRVVLDLNLDGALDAGLAWAAATGRPVAGFASHVDVPTIRAARAAGVDPVVPRSRVPEVLGAWIRG